jgi:hypothetical protein
MWLFILFLFFIFCICGYKAGRDKSVAMYAISALLACSLSYSWIFPINRGRPAPLTESEQIGVELQRWDDLKMVIIIVGTPVCAILIGLAFRLTSKVDKSEQ